MMLIRARQQVIWPKYCAKKKWRRLYGSATLSERLSGQTRTEAMTSNEGDRGDGPGGRNCRDEVDGTTEAIGSDK
jgi:hypothetical protein